MDTTILPRIETSFKSTENKNNELAYQTRNPVFDIFADNESRGKKVYEAFCAWMSRI